jgi:nicotinamide-nucleotide adenylyltransferase
MLTGLFIGRFQPFHLGHLATAKFALDNVERLVIVIGSAQRSHEMRNPFTAGERIQMIKDSLDADSEVDVKRILIIPVPDIDVHSLWVHQIDILVPKYEAVFTNDPFTQMLFKEKGTEIIEPLLQQRKVLSGTEIRSRMAKDEEWKKLVPLQTAITIEDIQGVQRIKTISQKAEENESTVYPHR